MALWVDRYCTPTGAGAHDGTSWADAWTFAEAAAGAGAKCRVNIEYGTYPLGAQVSPSYAPTAYYNPVAWVGLGPGGAPATSWAECPVLDFALSSDSYGLYWSNKHYTYFHGLRIKNTPAAAGYLVGNYGAKYLVSAENCGGSLTMGGSASAAIRCRALDNSPGGGLVISTAGALALLCEVMNCEATLTLSAQAHVVLCYSDYGGSCSTYGSKWALNTLVGDIAAGRNALTVTGALAAVVGNILENGAVGISDGSVYLNLLNAMNDLYGNTSDVSASPFAVTSRQLAVDPAHGGLASDDYSITETSLMEIADLAQAPNVGAHQASSGATGGGATATRRARARRHGV